MSANTFYDLLKRSAEAYSDNTAILYDTHATSYLKLFKDACRKAMHLREFDGKRIALIGPASYRWLVNFFGAILAGKDLVLLDSFLADKERHILLGKAKPDYILSSTTQYILADSCGSILPNAAENDRETEEEADLAALAAIDALSAGTMPEGNILFFTSGTSTLAKIVVLSSHNLMFGTLQASESIHCEASDRILSLLPLNHVFGLVYSILWPLSCGACVCIGRGIKHIGFDTIYYHPSILPIFPALLEGLIHLNALNQELKTIVIGESFCPHSTIHMLEDELRLQVYSIYGLTAASGGIAIASGKSAHEFVPYPDVNITIADDDEILVESSGIMTCYDNDAAETGRILDGGVLHSGDLGYINEAGHLIITGSKKNILALPNGEKINCVEVEEFFTASPSIDEAALALLNGAPTIFIYSAGGRLNDAQAQHIVDSYNKSKCVSRHIVHFRLLNDALPKDACGNTDRWSLAAV